jgi:PAS domain S-box-containing protein
MPDAPIPPDDWSVRLNRRLLAAAGVIVALALLGGILTQSTDLHASAALHLQIEYFAVFASISIFFLASAKYVISRERVYLPLSLGFLGASIFDLLHPLMPHGVVPATILGLEIRIVDLNGYFWWLARLSYGVGLLAAALALRRRVFDTAPNRILLRGLLWTLVEVILLGLLVAILPLPDYYGAHGIGRYLELLAALLFAGSALLLLRELQGEMGLRAVGAASLLLAIVTQGFAALSSAPGDAFFFATHAFKVASYLVVLFGLYLEHVNLYAREHALRKSIEEAEQEALRRRAELFAVIENTADGIAILDEEGRVLHLNRSATRLLEPVGARQWIGQRLSEQLPPKLDQAEAGAADKLREALDAALRGGRDEREVEIQVAGPDERLLYFSVGIVPLREESGRARGAVVDFHDVTSLRRAERRYRDLTEGAPDAIIEMDMDGNIMFFNAAAEKLFGSSSAEVMGKDVDILMPERYKSKHREGRDRFFQTGKGRLGGQPLELAALRRDGREVPIELTLSYGARRVTAVVRDVSKLARGRREKSGLAVVGQAVNATDTERDLCVQAAKALREALDHDTTRIFVKDRNKPFLQLAGHAAAGGDQAPPSSAGFKLEPPERSVFVDCLLERDPILLRGRAEIERRGPPTSPDVLDEDSVVVAIPILVGEQSVGVLSATTRASRHDPDEELQILQTISFQLALGISQKVLFHELQQTARNLEVTNRELDAFIYTASHDLAEPLRSMANFSQFLMEDYATNLDAQGQDYLRRIHDGAIRMRSLLDALLQISRIRHKPLPFETLDVKRLMQEVRESLDAMLRDRKAELVVHEPMPKVWAQPTRLMEVFTNLISNGLKFNESPTPRVEIRGETKNGFAEFSVQDNGIGIPEKYQDRVFGLFTRLHPRGQYPGTGAGLAIVRTIIEQHGGQVRIESKEGAGTKVLFTIPKEPR